MARRRGRTAPSKETPSDPEKKGPESRGRPGSRGALVAVLAVILLVALVRLRVADVPLERDEGEYAYAGQLILQGIPPYQIAYNMKFPGTYYAYALILALFGSTPWGIHVGLLLVNAATTLLVFALGRRMLGNLPAVVAASAFALLSLDRWIMGVFAHATHFVLLAALLGLFLLLRATESRRWAEYFGAGVLLGAAVLMKQHAIFFLPLGAALALLAEIRRETRSPRTVAMPLLFLAAGSAVPLAVLVVVFAAEGVLGRFWFWTFRYAGEYVSQVPLAQLLPGLLAGLRGVTVANLPLWLVGAAGVVALWVGTWEAAARAFVTGLLAASLLSVLPGLYFRDHYFILLLPAVALGAGVAVAALERVLQRIVAPGLSRVLALTLFVGAAAHYVATEREYLFSMPPDKVSRKRYGLNPFVEAPEIARYVRERTSPTDTIAVLGSEPEIYFYADRRSATGYIYTYPLLEPQPFAARMQREMIDEIQSARPSYVVFAKIVTSWLPRRESDKTILAWAERYTKECYDLVGIADIQSMDVTTYRFDEEVAGYRARSDNALFVFRRKGSDPCAVDPAHLR